MYQDLNCLLCSQNGAVLFRHLIQLLQTLNKWSSGVSATVIGLYPLSPTDSAALQPELSFSTSSCLIQPNEIPEIILLGRGDPPEQCEGKEMSRDLKINHMHLHFCWQKWLFHEWKMIFGSSPKSLVNLSCNAGFHNSLHTWKTKASRKVAHTQFFTEVNWQASLES